MLNDQVSIKKQPIAPREGLELVWNTHKAVFSRHSAPVTASLSEWARQGSTNRQQQNPGHEYQQEATTTKQASSIRNIRNSINRSSRSLENSAPQRLSIGLERATANKGLLTIFIVLLVLFTWTHYSTIIGPSKVFQRLEQTASVRSSSIQSNNLTVKLDAFRHQMLDLEGVTENDWSRFLEQVQNDERLIYQRNEQGEGIIRFDL